MNNNDNNYLCGKRAAIYIHDETGGNYVELPWFIKEKPIKIAFEGDWESNRNAEYDINCNDYYKFTARKSLTNLQKQQLMDLINEVRV